jgi:hypothetical protein
VTSTLSSVAMLSAALYATPVICRICLRYLFKLNGCSGGLCSAVYVVHTAQVLYSVYTMCTVCSNVPPPHPLLLLRFFGRIRKKFVDL